LIHENRDPAFWAEIASHPSVEPNLGGPFDPSVVLHPSVMPYASENGGYLLLKLDVFARLWDLHAAFRPAGWGREASRTLKAVLDRLPGWQVITVSEVEGNWRSRPPRSFGFQTAGQMTDGYRTWILTRERWEASPARRTACLQR
jgi:hypothetical protein